MKKHTAKPLKEHKVSELRKLAKKNHVKQVTSTGEHKNKAQLVASLKRATGRK